MYYTQRPGKVISAVRSIWLVGKWDFWRLDRRGMVRVWSGLVGSVVSSGMYLKWLQRVQSKSNPLTSTSRLTVIEIDMKSITSFVGGGLFLAQEK